MHEQTQLIKHDTRRPTLIRFWSDGKIAKTANRRIELLRSTNRTAAAKAMMCEWVMDQQDQQNI